MIGRTLAHYRITARLGAGGMGEVWRARDTRLDREVALKLLPANFASDPDRHARFEREARVLAALNHPHIATLYGLEQVGEQHALVMELVEGEDLAQRLERGAIPVEESIAIARQVAEALEAAHEKGIVHRDLKPANVKVRPDGTVKVLDFGLAKAFESEGSAADITQSPTVTASPTKAGMILGTAAYMSPEQARGKTVDKRADIWSFGVLVWEMLAGARLFAAGSFAETVSAVLQGPIDLAPLPASTPAGVRELVRRCLERDPKRRLRDIGEARIALETGAGLPSASRPRATPADSGAPALPSVAVLPFVNMSADQENEFFADGITEDVIAHLAKLRTLRVISRTSVMAFKKRDRSLREIGEQLGAGTLLEGSVRRAGNRVRIVAQLIDAASDEHIWADTYDRQLDDIFAIQTDVALQIAKALRAELSSDERVRLGRRPTDDLEAYDLYLRARAELLRFTAEGFRRSLVNLELALERDPGFALAHACVAQIHAENGIQGTVGRSPEASIRLAKKAAARALELDDELAEAHGVSGLIRFVVDFDWEGAEREFLKALDLSPGNAEIHDHYSWLLSALERYDDALREVRRARELDPLQAQSDVATTLLRAGRIDEALEEARRNLATKPDFARCHSNFGWALIFKGDNAAGIAALERAMALSPGDTLFIAQLGQAYAMTGNEVGAREIVDRLHEMARHQFVSPYHLAYVHSGLGELDVAMDELESAFDLRSGAIYGIKGSFLFRRLRGYPRFEALLRRMNL